MPADRFKCRQIGTGAVSENEYLAFVVSGLLDEERWGRD
jgi:hypothetical protein